MTTSSGLSVSVLYRRIVEDSQTTYMMLSRYVTPLTMPTTYNKWHMLVDCFVLFIHWFLFLSHKTKRETDHIVTAYDWRQSTDFYDFYDVQSDVV